MSGDGEKDHCIGGGEPDIAGIGVQRLIDGGGENFDPCGQTQ